MTARRLFALLALLGAVAAGSALAQQRPRTTAESVRGHFASINHRVLEMAKDFPDDKYGYQLKPEMRTFGAVIVHIASGNIYAAKAGRGENVNWDELDPKDYKTKAEVVALLDKSISDANATLKALPDDSFAKTVEPWLGVTEHSAEHYGLLIAYYRANGIVPPQSRPKK
jgi:DinB superfamily